MKNKRPEKEPAAKGTADKPVSLAPLEFEDAVRALLATKPATNDQVKPKKRAKTKSA